MAVAIAIVIARSGSPRAVPTAPIVAALAACRGRMVNEAVSPSPATVQCGGCAGPGDDVYCTTP
ncbi:hypothetical protein GCM10010417_20370 [Streptomyces carpaticus]